MLLSVNMWKFNCWTQDVSYFNEVAIIHTSQLLGVATGEDRKSALLTASFSDAGCGSSKEGSDSLLYTLLFEVCLSKQLSVEF